MKVNYFAEDRGEVMIEIKTELPGPKTRKVLKDSRMYEPGSMSEHVPIVWEKASGVSIEDIDGNSFLDFTSGVLVTNIGHSHPRYVEEVKKQAGQLIHCYDFVTSARVELAKKLVEITPDNLDKAFMLSTGSETIEAAIRLAKRYTGKYEIISFHGAFHGRTYGAASLAGKKGTKKGFGPLMPGVIQVPFPYCYRCPFDKELSDCNYHCLRYLDWALETESTGEVAALITEPYQGGSGSIIPPQGYMERLQEWCQEHEILFILDEVQSSFARTGRMFALEHYHIKPNLLCLGKGINGGGVPTSALMGESRIMDVLQPGEMSSTHGGNPLSCATSLLSIQIIEEEKLCQNSFKVGNYLIERFEEIKENSQILGDVRGLGLAIGLEIVEDKKDKKPSPTLAKKIIRECYYRGLVLIAPRGFYGNVVRICPPLVITQEQAEVGIKIMEDVLKEIDHI